MVVELSTAKSQWKRALMRTNNTSLPGLTQNDSRFERDCNFEVASTASNYGTASEFAFAFPFPFHSISISVSISIVSGFTTSHY